MISQINIAVNAAKPKFPLCPMVAFNGSPSSVRISGIPKTIGEWNISTVKVVVSYPTNVTLEKQATFVDGLWIATVDGSQMNGVVKNGFQIIADGVDEIGKPVTGYVLGVGDVVVLERDKGIEKLVQKYAMRYLNEPPTNPSIGDLLNLNGNVRIWDGSKWISVGGGGEVYDSAITLQANGVDIDSFTVNASEAKTIDIPVPSKTSELDNDSGFITSAAIPSKVSELDNDVGYVTAEAIPSKVSELDNDAGYITMSAIPAIPSKTSELDNDSGFITSAALSGYATENYVDGKVLALSSIYALDSDLDLVVASVSSMDGSIQTIDASVQTLELNVSDIQTYTGELGVSISALGASVSSIQTSLSTYATISYVD